MSGCTRATQVRARSPMNGLARPMLSWKKHFRRLKEHVPLGVPTADVQTKNSKQRWTWVNIFASMDLRKTIQGGSTMVKSIV
jgi:hypothetical protein